ncbi:hypothetical protein F2Q70_00016300 [Brassica cretica]|uniref:Uncharacterized protein n=1 Tax=Brassica cretica TaxID=69181 RepID=A0A8S9I4V6_BRACR|nr:hypothetical protein F2Q70_00016300 [Brassica cretica]KAF2597869.1 hypothetical protein F2Q68_00009275 [Brassica cretica]
MMVISLRSESSCEEEHVGVLKGYCFRWSLASTSVVVHIARCFLTSGGAMLSFQSYISASRVKESQVSVSRFKAQQGIHRDQEEQFKVELFESIAKLNKLKEFSKSSYTETASVVGIVRREYKKGSQVSEAQILCYSKGVSRVVTESFYIENLLNRVELSGVFCWSKQRRRVMFRFKVHTDWCRGKLQDKHDDSVSTRVSRKHRFSFQVMESAKGRSMKKFGMTKGCEVLRKALKKTLIEDWELSRLELGLQGSKEQRQESLQEYEAEKVISQDIARRCRGCRKVQGVAEVEQVCLITGEKLKRR